MGKTKAIEVSPEVEELFRATQSFVDGMIRSSQLGLKVQVEQDFRGKPVLSVRVREQNLEAPEIMKPLRYPEC